MKNIFQALQKMKAIHLNSCRSNVDFHFSKGSQEEMTKTCFRCQENICCDKMYPSITGFDTDMEHKSLTKRNFQIFSTVNCLTVDFWGRDVGADSLLTASFLRTCANSFLGKNSIETEDELKKAPTHSHDIENLFGIEGSIIIRFGAQVFKKVVH